MIRGRGKKTTNRTELSVALLTRHQPTTILTPKRETPTVSIANSNGTSNNFYGLHIDSVTSLYLVL